MQTFLPYPSFIQSAACLDYRRLGKQRVEARQILHTLKHGGSWSNHPAVKMWAGFEVALMVYSNTCIREWIERGYKNTMPIINTIACSVKFPPWLGDADFHASHRSNLLRKAPDYYGQFGWSEPNDLPYVWPVR